MVHDDGMHHAPCTMSHESQTRSWTSSRSLCRPVGHDVYIYTVHTSPYTYTTCMHMWTSNIAFIDYCQPSHTYALHYTVELSTFIFTPVPFLSLPLPAFQSTLSGSLVLPSVTRVGLLRTSALTTITLIRREPTNLLLLSLLPSISTARALAPNFPEPRLLLRIVTVQCSQYPPVLSTSGRGKDDIREVRHSTVLYYLYTTRAYSTVHYQCTASRNCQRSRKLLAIIHHNSHHLSQTHLSSSLSFPFYCNPQLPSASYSTMRAIQVKQYVNVSLSFLSITLHHYSSRLLHILPSSTYPPIFCISCISSRLLPFRTHSSPLTPYQGPLRPHRHHPSRSCPYSRSIRHSHPRHSNKLLRPTSNPRQISTSATLTLDLWR